MRDSALRPSLLDRLPPASLLLACFFVSGACGLVYEIAWLRVLGLIFGNTTYATSTVLAGYMAGLGLGALLVGRKIDRGGQPVRVYARLEAGVGIYAFATPLLWKALDLLNIGFYRAFRPDFAVSLVFKFAAAFAALAVPTFLMGGTLPVLSKFFVREEKETAKKIGLLYGLNTLGAVFGVFFSAFFGLQTLGVWQTVALTGVLNLAIFGVCRRVAERLPETPQPARPPTAAEPASPRPALLWCLLAAFAVSGAVSMMYEIAWTRSLAVALGSSVYAFSIMLATFLFGIALGSYALGLAEKRIVIDLQLFAFLELLAAAAGFSTLNFLADMPYYFLEIFRASKGSLFFLETGKFLLSCAVMLPATFCIGALFACFVHITRRARPVGAELGEAYFANTLGTIAGSVLTGFAAIPLLGVERTLLAAGTLSAGIGVFCYFLAGRRLAPGRLAVLAALVFAASALRGSVRAWDHALFTSGIAIYPERVLEMDKKQILESMREREVFFYKEATSATVSVVRYRDNLSLAVNGKVDASNQDSFTQFLLGHLPMLLHPAAQNVLVIGLGSASTSAAVASYPGVKSIDTVELEGAVIEAAKFFTKLNRNVLRDPRHRIHVNDGRNFLLVNPDRYDVIISEPSNPWIAGVANLFSLEHYRTMAKRLRPGGIVCQWLHAYSMSPEDLRMIIRTFSLAFKDTSLWMAYYPDLMLIGSTEKLPLDFAVIRRNFEAGGAAADLGPYGIAKPEGLFASYWLEDAELRRLVEGAAVNRDNRPILEFSAPKSLYRRSSVVENFRLLDRFAARDYARLRNLEPPLEKNAAFYASIAAGFVIKHLFAQAQWAVGRAKAIAPEAPETLLAEGLLAAETGDKPVARGAFEKLVRLRPETAEAHYRLGLLRQQSGDLPAALAAFREAARLEPRTHRYLAGLAGALLQTPEAPAAIGVFDRMAELETADFDSWAKRTFLVFKIGSFKEKLRAGKAFLAKYPRFGLVYEWMGETYEAQGDLAEALRSYEAVSLLQPEKPGHYLNLARVSDKMGKKEDVKKYLGKAIDFDPALARNPEVVKALSR